MKGFAAENACNTWFSSRPQWYLEVKQCIFQRYNWLLLGTLCFLIDLFLCKMFTYNEQNCLPCSQKWWWCFKIIPFFTLSSRKVSIRVLRLWMHVRLFNARWPCQDVDKKVAGKYTVHGSPGSGLVKNTVRCCVCLRFSQQETRWSPSTRKCAKKCRKK